MTNNKKTNYMPFGIRLEDGVPAYTHADHLGSPVAGTDETGTVLWRERYTPFGQKLINPSANKDNTGYTSHIDDASSGLTYMQARYYDPNIGRFLVNDPVGFAEGGPAYFNRYAYVVNNPINAIDPNGEKAYLVSRSAVVNGSPFKHAFVLVVDDNTGDVTRYSYGPSDGQLVSVTGSRNNTDNADQRAADAFLANPDTASKQGVSATEIDAPDADVIAAGEQVDSALGNVDNPGNTTYALTPAPISPPSVGNSNSAAFAVANRAVQNGNPDSNQTFSCGATHPGCGQDGHIPDENGKRN